VVFGGVLAALAVGSVALMVALYHPGLDPIRVYYGTTTRAAELLIGALLAVVLAGRGQIREWWARNAVAAAGLAGLALTLWWWTSVDLRTTWLYQGGLAVYALASAAIIFAAINVTPVRGLLSVTPLTLLGRISYGVYLYHWPIFLWLSPRRTGLSLWPLFGLRMAVTLMAATASYHLLEMPVRARRWPTGSNRLLVAPVAITCVVVGILAVTWDPPSSELDFTSAPSEIRDAPTAADGPAHDPAVVERVLLMGDSVMQQAYPAIESRLVRDEVQVGYAGGPGTGPLFPQDDWLGQMDDWMTRFRPDVVVIEACCDYTDFADELYVDPEGNEVLPGTDAMFVAWEAEARQLIERATADGTPLLWVMPPPVQTNGFYGPIEEQVDRLREMYEGFGEIQGVSLLEWDEAVAPDGTFTWDAAGPDGDSARARADDGVHMTEFGNVLLARTTLAAIYEGERRPPAEAPPAAPAQAAQAGGA
jgi:hypothetical protein